jgi:hypothetical protein
MDLADIEAQLLEKAQAERRRWQEIAALLMECDQHNLWSAQAPSFTAWVRSIARRAELEESVFWRCLKAGRIYTELTGQDVREVRAQVSAESLELADKISRHAPESVVQEVLTRTLDVELSRNELREVWSTYKPAAGGITARGRLPEDDAQREQALQARKSLWESEKQKPEHRLEVARGELLSAFRHGHWLKGAEQTRADSRLSSLPRNVAAVLVARRVGDQELDFHALLCCASEPELRDFDYTPTPGADFMWLGVPSKLVPTALAKAPRMLGLLELRTDQSLTVAREAHRRQRSAQGRLDMLTALLSRAYLWP